MSKMPEQSQPTQSQETGDAIAGRIQIVLIVVLIVGALIINRVLGYTAESTPLTNTVTRPPAATIVQPRIQSTTIQVEETGTINARTNVAIAPLVGGRIVEVAPSFRSGGRFDAHQTVFRIDPVDYRLQLQQARADLQSAEANLVLEIADAEVAMAEWRLVNEDEPIPALVAREPQIAQARSVVAAAKARVSAAELDLRRTEFNFPFDGRVLSSNIEIGQSVNPNATYGLVYSSATLEAAVSLSLDTLRSIEPAIGRRALVRQHGDPFDAITEATVVRVEAELDSRTRFAGLVLGFDTPPPFLPGAFVDVAIEGNTYDNVYVLPTDVISMDGVVWVVEEGLLQLRRPQVVARSADAVTVAPFDFADGVVTVPPANAIAGLQVAVVLNIASGSPEVVGSRSE